MKTIIRIVRIPTPHNPNIGLVCIYYDDDTYAFAFHH